MKKLLSLVIFCLLIRYASAQTIPAGFAEKYSRITPGTGTADNFFPGLQIKAYVSDKKDAGGSQRVIWVLKVDEHSYKELKLTKFITTVCGKVEYPVTFLSLKPGEVRYWKTAFGLEEYIGEKEFKTNGLPVTGISIDNLTCKLDDDDRF